MVVAEGSRQCQAFLHILIILLETKNYADLKNEAEDRSVWRTKRDCYKPAQWADHWWMNERIHPTETTHILSHLLSWIHMLHSSLRSWAQHWQFTVAPSGERLWVYYSLVETLVSLQIYCTSWDIARWRRYYYVITFPWNLITYSQRCKSSILQRIILITM